MKLYYAPLEGITTYTYRNAHAEMFGGCDNYFAPFIVPTENERISLKTLRDILKDNNVGEITPQILNNNDKAFIKFAEKVFYLGYDELNLNLGCPSGTVVNKNRGSGMLKDTEFLERFLDSIFTHTKIKISIKTRAGFYDHSEFDNLLNIYNKYPVSQLIIHPRVREEFYKGEPNLETFDKAYNSSLNKLCYNGNIYSKEDYNKIKERYEKTDSVMIGRGAVRNPAIFREIKGGAPLKTDELIAFSRLLEEKYMALFKSEIHTLHKLKEVWIYMIDNFPEEKKIAKAIKKSNKLTDINNAINGL